MWPMRDYGARVCQNWRCRLNNNTYLYNRLHNCCDYSGNFKLVLWEIGVRHRHGECLQLNNCKGR